MAYTRDYEEKFEVDYPLETIWKTIPKAVKALKWKVEEENLQIHSVKLKTTSAFLSFSSTVEVTVSPVNEKTSRLTVSGETPVTTITSMVDFGTTRDRIEMFVEELARQLQKTPKKSETSK
jgi:carbon monoxide dehydrogenase subunit G